MHRTHNAAVINRWMEAVLVFKSITYWPFQQNWFHLFTIYAHLNTLNLVYNSLAISIRSQAKRLFQFYTSKFSSISDVLLNFIQKILSNYWTYIRIVFSSFAQQNVSICTLFGKFENFFFPSCILNLNSIHSFHWWSARLRRSLGRNSRNPVFFSVLMLIDLSF